MDASKALSLLDLLLGGGTPFPCKIRLWDGTEKSYGNGDPEFVLHFRNKDALESVVADPSLGFGQAYTRGDIEVEGDLGRVVALSYLLDLPSRFSLGQKARLCWLGIRGKRNLKQARKDIEAHYDRGNDFYGMWLDEGMNYSCAFFKDPSDTLEAAQERKILHSLGKLRLSPGQRLLDIGCGWGSLAILAARRFDVHAVGMTLSRKQHEYAVRRVEDLGLGDRVEIRLQDYRELRKREYGTFDKVVSIGMFEHVGKGNIRLFFRKCKAALKPGGLLLLHTICRISPQPTDPWIQTFIFPGGYIPALGEVVEAADGEGLDFLDLEDLRRHYDLTLGHWIRRFEARSRDIEDMMGEQFVRMWRLYLNGSQMAFRHGALHVFQLLFSKGRLHDWPLTREWFYTGGARGQVA